MAGWIDVLDEIKRAGSGFDTVRRRHLQALREYTGRNVVSYYSAFLQRSDPAALPFMQIRDEDKVGFMASFKDMDFDLGLDLLVHSPGGDVAATESIIDYLRQLFGSDIRVIVPQISMSGGTMIACCGKSIVMGKHSNLGPIDPQFGGLPAQLALQEIRMAKQEIINNPASTSYWATILSKYPAAFEATCDNAIKWSSALAKKALGDGMFKDFEKSEAKVDAIVTFLSDHKSHLSHGRHIHREELKEQGVIIEDLEADKELQDLVLTVHHAFTISMMNTDAVKIIENHDGEALVKSVA